MRRRKDLSAESVSAKTLAVDLVELAGAQPVPLTVLIPIPA